MLCVMLSAISLRRPRVPLGDGPLGMPLGGDLDFTDSCGKMPLFWAASCLAGILYCVNEEREPSSSTDSSPLLSDLDVMWPVVPSSFCLNFPTVFYLSNRQTTKI